MNTIATDNPLSEEETETLASLVSMMIPASTKYEVPGADDKDHPGGNCRHGPPAFGDDRRRSKKRSMPKLSASTTRRFRVSPMMRA